MKRISFAILAAVVLSYGLAFGNAITVNNVQGSFGTAPEDTVQTGVNVKFMLRYQNTQGIALSIFNGYEIYSPDGATWSGPLVGDSTSGPGAPLTKGSGNFDLAFSIGVFDGATKDTFGIGGQKVSGPGLPIGYNNVPYGLGIGSFDAAEAGLTICIDSAWYRPAGTWKWTGSGGVTVLPTWGGPYCYTLYEVPNLPPTITNAPVDITNGYCQTFTFDFNGVDPEPDPFTFELVSGPGSIDANTGVWTWNGATIGDVGASINIEVRACDAFSCGPSVIVPIIVTNTAPVITGCPAGQILVSEGTNVTTDLGVTDECAVPLDTWSVAFVSGNAAGDVVSVDANGVVSFTPGTDGAPRIVCVDVTVNDGGLEDVCQICYDVVEGSFYGVQISKEHNVIQGGYWDVPVMLNNAGPDGMGGFSFLISYDQSALVLSGVTIGSGIGPAGCGWEYFTYRFGAFGNCTGGCPSGLVQVTGIAESNNGPNHPACTVPDPLPAELFVLTFLVSNDRTLECQFAPIRFFWLDCTDNTISSDNGAILFISATVADFYNVLSYIDETVGVEFPTYLGAQEECEVDPDGTGPKQAPDRNIDFINGGIDIVCADSIDARGDVNLNGIGHEIADAVMFTRYFIVGMAAFTPAGNPAGSIAATEINGDGAPLTVADLVYLIRVIVGDALPLPKVAPVVVNLSNNAGVLSVDAEIAAASIVVKGDARPTLLANNMTMISNFDGTNTRILVYPPFEGVTSVETFSGSFISIEGTIVSVEMATPEAGVAKVEGGLTPSAFVLEDNYPNPFNPSTTVGFSLPVSSDVTLTVYNVTGQRVYEVSNTYTAGNHSMEIKLDGQASGIYFYKLTAGSFSETKKMVFLK